MSLQTSQKPYVGLIPFHEEDAEFFYGREQEREIITSNLMASRLTLLYGASGVGKSSVLHAGVAHHLRALARRDIKRRGKPKFTVVIFSAWRDEPVTSLLAHVQKAVMKTLEGQHVDPVAPNLPFVESLREWSRRVQGQLLIILDQFEEYFLYHLNEDGEGTFAVEFPRAVLTPGLPANFIVSYREDAHAKLDFFKGRIPNLYDNYLRIGHLGYEAARAAIEKPIARYNELNGLDQNNSFHIQEELIAAVLSQVRAGEKYIGDTGSGIVGHQATDGENWEVETPYLQLVMTRLWDTEINNGSRVLQLETLNKLGGAKHIVQSHLDNAMGQLSAKEQLMGANIFNYLVTPSGTKIAQTAHDLADYAKLSTEKEKQLDQMMKKLTAGDQRILRSVPPPANQPNANRYEVFHDVLAQAIIAWRRRFLARRDRIRLLRVVGAMALIALFMAGLAGFAFQQASAARRAEEIALEYGGLAAEKAKEAEQQAEAARIAENLARMAEDEADEQKQKAVRSAVLANKSEEHAKDEAEKNQKLAGLNKELANKFERAYESERVAKLEAENQKARALEAVDAAEAAATEAGRQKGVAVAAAKTAKEEKAKADAAAKKAEEALATVDEIDASNAYYKTVMRPRSNVNGASFSPDGKKALTVTDDGVVRVWDVNSTKKPNEATHELTLDTPMSTFENASFSHDGKLVITVGFSGEDISGLATVWDISREKPVNLDHLSIDDGPRPTKKLKGAAFTENDQGVIAYGEQEYRSCKLDRTTGKLKECITRDMSGNFGRQFIEAISPNAKFLALTAPENLYILNVPTGNLIKLDQPSFDSGRFVFSSEGKYVAIVNQGNDAKVFDTATGKLVSQFDDHALVTHLAFSQNSELAVTGDVEGWARVWEVATRKHPSTHSDHKAAITDLAFSPDGKYVVSASADKTARVWAVADGNLFAELRGHIGSVNSASFAFTQDGNFVLTSGDKTARVWDVTRRSDAGISQGEVEIINNGTFDLDSGSSNPPQVLGVSGADLSWRYSEKSVSPGGLPSISWNLNPENKAQIAFFSDAKASGSTSAGNRKFEDISVTELIGLNYSSTGIVGGAVDERGLGQVNNTLAPDSIFAVRTTEGNYAKVQVIQRASTLTIRWVTYKNPGPQQSPPRSAQNSVQPPGNDPELSSSALNNSSVLCSFQRLAHRTLDFSQRLRFCRQTENGWSRHGYDFRRSRDYLRC